jgi:LCP family protein required for cell wall assembly
MDQSERRWRVAGYTIGIFFCLIFMIAGVVFGNFYHNSKFFRQLMQQNAGAIISGTILHGNPLEEWTPEKQFPDTNSINVVVMGVDYDWSNTGHIIRSSARSDALLVAHIDFVKKTITGLTIPRDTAVHIPGRKGIHKINAAHAYGGPQLTDDTIKEVFGIPTDAYVVLDIQGFQELIDALGGIDITIHKKLNYDDNWGHLHIHLKPGFQHLNGYQAMGYVRMRHSDSDFMRSQRQHEFMEAVRDKIKSPSSFLKLPGVLDKLHDQLALGNLNMNQLLSIMNFARTLPRQNVVMETLPSFEGPSFVTIDTAKSAKLIQSIFFPDQQYASVNIDAPDPYRIRELNARYDHGGSRRSSSHRIRHHVKRETKHSEQQTQPAGDLNVEPTSSGDSGSGIVIPEPASSPGSDNSGGSSGSSPSTGDGSHSRG